MIEDPDKDAESAQPNNPEHSDQPTEVDNVLTQTREQVGAAEQSEQVKAAYFVQICLVVKYNHDVKDIIAGGSKFLGPYMWVHESHKDRWVKDMQKKYGNSSQIYVEPKRTLFECDKIPSYEEQMEEFEKFVSNPSNW